MRSWRGVGLGIAAAVTALTLVAGADATAASPARTESDAAPVDQAGSAPGPTASLVSDGVPEYLSAVYADLFGRDVDPTGAATWSTALRSGTPRRAVSDAITGSREFRTGLITSAYEWFLFREPEPTGLESWLREMDRGLTIQQMEAGFLGSDEYYQSVISPEAAQYPSMTMAAADEWIWAVYEDVLGREPSRDEADRWEEHLFHSIIYRGPLTDPKTRRYPKPSDFPVLMSRAEVALAILLSTERLSADLDGDYQWLLGRGLDPNGQATWVRQIQGGVRYEEVIGSIIASDEYWGYATAP